MKHQEYTQFTVHQCDLGKNWGKKVSEGGRKYTS